MIEPLPTSNDELQRRASARQFEYWRKLLADAPASLALPIDRERPAASGTQRATQSIEFDGGIAAVLASVARGSSDTLFSMLLATFSVLLARYSGQYDLCIGTPVPGPAHASDFGPNSGTAMILRNVFAPETPFSALCDQITSSVLEAHANADVLFATRLDALDPNSRPECSRPFQVAFALHAMADGGSRLSYVSESDLALDVSASADALLATFDYNADIFDAATVARMARHFARLLEGLVVAPERPVGEIAMFDDEERRQLVVEWNDMDTVDSEGQTIHALFERQVKRDPAAVALLCNGVTLSYGELDERANGLAHYLRSLGVGPDVLVGICVERSPDLIVGLLGILKAGGAYVPLDPTYPAERLSYMIEDAAPTVMLTHHHLRHLVAAGSFETLCLDTDWDRVAFCRMEAPKPLALTQNLAYVIYTSGSTGKAKGTLIEHRSTCTFILWAAKVYGPDALRKVVAATSICFDLSVFEIFVTLSYGGSVLLLRDILELQNEVACADASLINTVPSAIAELLRADAIPRSVRIINLAGEALPGTLVRALYERQPGGRIYNLYGPSEDTTYSTFVLTDDRPGKPSIGRPIANTRTYILDAMGQPVPLGVAGELYIAGDGLARGYLRRPDLTAEKFVPDPFGAPGSRMYRTGDLARYLADRNIDYLGRIDAQVKIRGFRIEPGEIEAALDALTGVRESLVLAHEDVSGDKRLVAYVVWDASATVLDAAALRSALQRTLPDFMVPTNFIALERFPLTANGKIDRRSLPLPDSARSDDGYVAPRTPTEEILTGIWAVLLRLDKIGLHDNFFELGGHSLLATRVVSQVRQDLAVELQPNALFAAPTIGALAECVETARRRGTETAMPPLVPVPRGASEQPSYAQQGLWFLDQLEAGGARYNMPLALQLRGTLDVDALRRALNDITCRHEALRATFVFDGATVVLRTLPTLDIALPLADLSDLPHGEQEAKMRWLMEDAAQARFDLAHGPLLRANLLRRQADEHVLLLTMHHIVSDGWSLGVLIDEFGALYQSYVERRTITLPSLPVQYADFAHWQRQWLTGPVLARQLDYWSVQLADSPVLLTLPADRTRPSEQSYSGATHHFTLEKEHAAGLYLLGRTHSCTLFMTLLAGFAALLARYSGQQDICVGAPIANRNRTETEGLIGFFANTLVMRCHVDPAMSFATLLAQTKETSLGAYTHQDVAFEQLLDALKPERHLSHSPLFQAVLVLQNTRMDAMDAAGIRSSIVNVSTGTTKFDIVLSVTERDGGLDCHFEYSTDLFNADRIARMAEHFQKLLAAAVADPQAAVGDMEILTVAERRNLLGEWNTPVSPGKQCSADTLHGLFEAKAAQWPHSIALVYEGKQVTYCELNSRANRLARHLRTMGIGPDKLVGLCLERSTELVVALLAVLKAGGAYVPLDPDYPAERLAYMIDDAKPIAVITHSELLPQLLPHAQPKLCIDQLDAVLQGYHETNPSPLATADNLAYVIYTSGSTGRPKGALLQHSNVLRLFSTTAECFQFDRGDTWTMFHSYAFDFSVWEIWGAFLYGGKLVIVPYLVSRSPEMFHALLVHEKVTVLNQTPSAFKQLVDHDTAQEGATELSLRYVIFGGEALNQAALAPWFARHGDRSPQLVNMYGITETTVHVTFQPLAATAPDRSAIGRPIPDLTTYILDARLNLVPVGVAGELYVAGPGLARGYLGRPDLSAMRFLPDPYGPPGGRMYRSGDLARYQPDGCMEYLGRIDNQVKIRGFRIELGEIEATLAQHGGVLEATVMVREDRPGDKQLAAYVVPRDGVCLSVSALRTALLQTLPDYMVPPHFVILSQLPLTSNGKIDRCALPPPEAGNSGQPYTAPRNPSEATLARIWGEVLQVTQVGVHDNYFAIGGDSMRSIAILARAREQGMHITLEQLFTQQTIAAVLGEDVVKSNTAGPREPRKMLLSDADRARLPASVEDAYRLSRLQMAMVYHAQLTGELGTYHDIETLRLTVKTWNIELFRTALDTLAQRHAILRTSFDLSNYSEPLQLIHRHTRIPCHVVDIADLPAAEQERAIDLWCGNERKRTFDLETAPLVSICVHELGIAEVQYSFSCHHAILDGWSVATFHSELFACYHELVQNGAAVLDARPPAATFKEMVASEQAALDDERSRQFWQGHLEGHLLTRLPLNPEQDEPAGNDSLAVPVPESVHIRLCELANRLQLPVKTLYFTAHLRALAFASGTLELTSGLVSHCRPPDDGGSRVLGLFLNTLPFRMRLPHCSWAELAVMVFRQEVALLEYRHYPYTQLYLDNDRHELFDTAFNYIHFHVFDSMGDNTSVRVTRKASQDSTEFALMTHVVKEAGTIRLLLDYDRQRLSHMSVTDFARCMQAVLVAMAATPDVGHLERDLLGERARRDLLVNWNQTDTASTSSRPIQEPFEQYAAATPEALALISGSERISYGELNSRSNKLAHYLRAVGVGPDVAVGICVDRSPALVIAVLAVLKAGGAYVALDPAYPAHRLSFMLDDVRPVLLLTQSKLSERLPVTVPAFCLDLNSDLLAELDDANLEVQVPSEALAYVLYTSGSTGRPKGVGLSVAALDNLLAWQQAAHPVDAGSSTLQFASLNFDVSFQEIFSTLCGGGTLVLVDNELRHDLERLAEMISDAGIHRLFLPNAVLQQLAELFPATAAEGHGREVYSAGEQLVVTPAVESLLARLGGAVLYNQYGPSETHVVTEYNLALPSPYAQRVRPPIGRPIANTQLYILDDTLHPVPVGVAGQLYIAGAGLARGYLNRPAATAENFIPNPFGAPGTRMYRSGDLARYLPDGHIEYLGRADFQVKIRGFRVEPGEIEAALLALPELRETVVVVREEASGDKRLVAYVVTEKRGGLDGSTLRADLSQRLPEHMIPAHFVFLDRLPLTANGKVDKSALPDPQATAGEREYVGPQTETECRIAAIWSESFGMARVSAEDSFLGLGGHSLQATRIIARMRREFSTDLTLRMLLEAPDLASLAQQVDAALWLGSPGPSVAVEQWEEI